MLQKRLLQIAVRCRFSNTSYTTLTLISFNTIFDFLSEAKAICTLRERDCIFPLRRICDYWSVPTSVLYQSKCPFHETTWTFSSLWFSFSSFHVDFHLKSYLLFMRRIASILLNFRLINCFSFWRNTKGWNFLLLMI